MARPRKDKHDRKPLTLNIRVDLHGKMNGALGKHSSLSALTEVLYLRHLKAAK